MKNSNAKATRSTRGEREKIKREKATKRER
jgi:hypothetical protein